MDFFYTLEEMNVKEVQENGCKQLHQMLALSWALPYFLTWHGGAVHASYKRIVLLVVADHSQGCCAQKEQVRSPGVTELVMAEEFPKQRSMLYKIPSLK